MLSRIMQRNVLRGALQVSKAIRTDGAYVCFCGCRDGQHKQFNLISTPSRNFQGHLGLDSSQNLVPVTYKANEQVALWKDIKAKQDHSLVLKTNDEITDYVLSIVRNYFRTTKKASVNLESSFKDHGLDSLDVIELVI